MFNRKGQNIAEYSILIALVIAAAVAMQVYIKRGLQGRVADAVDHAPSAGDITGTGQTLNFTSKQYEPYYQDKSENVASTRTLNEVAGVQGQTQRTNIIEGTTRGAGSYDASRYEGTTAR